MAVTQAPPPPVVSSRPAPLPSARRRSAFPTSVTLIAVAVAMVATIWSAHSHSMVLYADARAHLDIARRVTDGLTPGLAQLGTVWLPVPHLLLVPLVAITPLWHSAAAGAIVGGGCFVYSAVRIFTLVEELTDVPIAAWCAFAVYCSNLNLLYMQSTALTEPVLLAFFVGAIYHLARWMRTRSVRSLATAALFTTCAAMSRYEGWVLLATAVPVVLIWSRANQRSAHETQANTVLFLAIGGYGIFLWVLYNLIIFHDPLYFIDSSFSAQSQQVALAGAGLLGTKGHLLESFLTYGWAVIDVAGPVVVVMGVLSAACAWVVPRPDRRRLVAVLLLLASPIGFNIVALWAGQSTLRVPQLPPHGLFNDRYGLVALPFLAVAAGILVSRWRRLGMAVIAAAAVSLAIMASGTPTTIQDGRFGASSAATGRPELAAAYLRQHYRGGEVLADSSRAEPLIFASRLDLREFVTIGFRRYYQRAIRSPGTTVAWAVVYDSDDIAADMGAHPGRFSAFRLVIRDGDIRLYQRLPENRR